MHTLAIILVIAALAGVIVLYVRSHRESPNPKLAALNRMPEREVGNVMRCIANSDFKGADELIKPYIL